MWKFRNLKGTSRAGAKGKGVHPAEAAAGTCQVRVTRWPEINELLPYRR